MISRFRATLGLSGESMQQHFAPSQAELRNEWMFNGWMLTVVPAKSALITEIRRTVISEATVDSGPPHGRRDREQGRLQIKEPSDWT